MANKKAKQLDRKKLLGDPLLVTVILAIMAFLLLFIVYPLWTVTLQSFSRSETGMIQEVKETGEWLTSTAKAMPEEFSQPVSNLGAAATAFYQNYNRYRRNNAEGVVNSRAELKTARSGGESL